MDVVPTFTTSNARLCLLLPDGRYGLLRMEDAERLQVKGERGVTGCVCTCTALQLLVVIVFSIQLPQVQQSMRL